MSRECFQINISLRRYKGTEIAESCFLCDSSEAVHPPHVRLFIPATVQMSVLILSKELSIFVRVFLMRSAVSLADGFWYQHSFISLAMEVKVWKEGGIKIKRCRISEAQDWTKVATHWVWKPSVWDVGPLLIHTHNLPHVLETGIVRDHIVKRGLVVFYNSYEKSTDRCYSVTVMETTDIRFVKMLMLSDAEWSRWAS